MRVVIEQDLKFNIEDVVESKDTILGMLRSNCVAHSVDDTFITIYGQKVDLDECDMEDVLSTIDYISCKRVNLVRYEYGRYYLVLE